MSFIDEAKRRAGTLVAKVKDTTAAVGKWSEAVASDPHVASSRAGKGSGNGSYVGRTGSDVALDVEESGAEARSEQKRNAAK